MSGLVTLAIRDGDLEAATTAIAQIIRRRCRVTAGGFLCLIDHTEDELASEILKWIAQRRLSVFASELDAGSEETR